VHQETPDNDTVVLCHAPSSDRAGMRVSDEWAAPGCRTCHDAVDGRGYVLSSELLTETWFIAIRRWQQHLMTMRLMKVEGTDPRPPTVRDF